ncbi:calcium uptake protein 1 homolog, mitochondrial [Drosophila ficusphila]|uniref:calcium uptake protein 1 homolog, mitochondrial n=1 Tax=Drosophila ficusphila TaxID=30025 RepID=UPI001C899FD2|nr:calcium uptake protein 1 homolog, mitochondrial [Drosophila ficusphila]XP_043064866.1 calcium uptake protein 1 homolog, mitochondrial [Drosophila ficusphila]
MYSHPLKIFRYFATIKKKNKSDKWELYMTPSDFLRSIQPGVKQPENYGLDKYHILDEKAASKWQPSVSQDSIFLKFEEKGLLTYSDYMLLSILLCIPERKVRIGFKLFDLNGDGDVSIQDLETVLMTITKGEASLVNSHLKRYLFGPYLNKTLSINEFLAFLHELHTEIHKLQFQNLLKPSRSVISEVDFAKVVLGYRNFSERLETLKRVKEKFGEMKRGITLEEFLAFFRFIQDVNTIDHALTFYYLTGADISPETLRHISHVVSGVKLSEHLTDVIFCIFDRNRDNIIERKEFNNMKQHWMHPVPLRRNLRLSSAFCIICKCSWNLLPSWNLFPFRNILPSWSLIPTEYTHFW